MGIFIPEYVPLMDQIVCSTGSASGFLSSLDWASTSFIALVVSVFFIAFFYLLATFFQNQQMIAFIKMEFYEVIISIVILVVIYMLLNGACSTKTGAIFPEVESKFYDKTIYYSATNLLTDFSDYTLIIMNIQYILYVYIDYVTSEEIYSTPAGVGATLKPTLGLGAAIKPVLNNAFTAEIIGVITTYAQAYVIDYGTYGLLKYFLPFALILRCFTLTRRIGGTIIAIVLVFLFIYPLLIIPTYTVVNVSLRNSIDYFKTAWGADVFNPLTPIVTVVEILIRFLWGPETIMFFSLMVMPAIAKIFIGAVFIPLFNTLIIITLTRYLSKSLGEEIDITNLTRMI
ncbi:MAG: hypothetical protein AB1391_02405 [Candidatus Micrarchaeota archaeon]